MGILYPKILVIGQTFGKRESPGVMLSNLFKGWPKEKIAVAASGNLYKDMDTSVCNTYYQLGYNNKSHPFPLSIFLPKIKCGELPVVNENSDQIKENKGVKSGKSKLPYGNLEKALHFFGLFNVFYKLKATPEFIEWIKKYNPDIIYTQLGTLELISFINIIHKLTNKPVAIHMMDDWPLTFNKKGLFKNFWDNKIDSGFRLLLDNTALFLSISDLMAQEYKKRYGKNSIAFHNPVELEFWKSHQRKNYELNKNSNILYAGRIGLGIDTTLMTMAEAIDKINVELQVSIQFILQSKNKPVWTDKYKCIRYNALVSYNELPRIFAEADFLYLPYDFSAASIKFIKYSMPTKASEYMISGTPIIIFAPAETALVKHAQNGKWAKVITENNISKLIEIIKQLLTDETERKQIALNAILLAEANFDSVIVRDKFRETIRESIK